ncbi:MAG: GNAT family N-acetyltransferase, partial [Elusimicrobia bacterium]|nr:GNAT family N-acetyltransferase [Elusimicrobiota bacterium]
LLMVTAGLGAVSLFRPGRQSAGPFSHMTVGLAPLYIFFAGAIYIGSVYWSIYQGLKRRIANPAQYGGRAPAARAGGTALTIPFWAFLLSLGPVASAASRLFSLPLVNRFFSPISPQASVEARRAWAVGVMSNAFVRTVVVAALELALLPGLTFLFMPAIGVTAAVFAGAAVFALLHGWPTFRAIPDTNLSRQTLGQLGVRFLVASVLLSVIFLPSALLAFQFVGLAPVGQFLQQNPLLTVYVSHLLWNGVSARSVQRVSQTTPELEPHVVGWNRAGYFSVDGRARYAEMSAPERAALLDALGALALRTKPESNMDITQTTEEARRFLEDAGHETLLLYDEQGRLLGFAFYRPLGDRVMLDLIAVDSAIPLGGRGAALMDTLFQLTRARGIDRIDWTAVGRSPRFYHRYLADRGYVYRLGATRSEFIVDPNRYFGLATRRQLREFARLSAERQDRVEAALPAADTAYDPNRIEFDPAMTPGFPFGLVMDRSQPWNSLRGRIATMAAFSPELRVYDGESGETFVAPDNYRYPDVLNAPSTAFPRAEEVPSLLANLFQGRWGGLNIVVRLGAIAAIPIHELGHIIQGLLTGRVSLRWSLFADAFAGRTSLNPRAPPLVGWGALAGVFANALVVLASVGFLLFGDISTPAKFALAYVAIANAATAAAELLALSPGFDAIRGRSDLVRFLGYYERGSVLRPAEAPAPTGVVSRFTSLVRYLIR